MFVLKTVGNVVLAHAHHEILPLGVLYLMYELYLIIVSTYHGFY